MIALSQTWQKAFLESVG